MKNGDKATLVLPPVQGEIISTRWDDVRDVKEHLLRWVDAAGETHERWFQENELAAAPEEK